MRTLTLLLLFLAPALAHIQNAPSLVALRDKSRVLLIFAPSDRTPEFQRQLALLSKHVYDLRQRDLVLLPVVTITSPLKDASKLRVAYPPVATQTEQLNLRHRFHVAPHQFTVILIGKDGGEKLRQKTPVAIDELNATIDAMPMRQDEMRQKDR